MPKRERDYNDLQRYRRAYAAKRRNETPRNEQADTQRFAPVRWNGDEDAPGADYRESSNFKSYRSFVEKTLKSLKRPVTIRELNQALGEMRIDKYTCDALETSVNVLLYSGYVDHFLWIKAAHKPEPLMWNGCNQLVIKDRPRNVVADLGLGERVTA